MAIKNIYSKKLILLLLTVIFVILLSETLYRVFDDGMCLNNSYATHNFQFVPEDILLAYEFKPNYSWDKFYSTNSQGFRDREYDFHKPNNTVRIVVLGDSVTFGPSVPLNMTYPKLLESMLNQNSANYNYEVLNLGVTGYSTLQEMRLLQTKGMQYQPDFVIIGYFLNDPLFLFPLSPECSKKRESIISTFVSNKCALKSKVQLFFQSSPFVKKSSLQGLFKKLSNDKDPDRYKSAYDDPCSLERVNVGFGRISQTLVSENISGMTVIFPEKSYYDGEYVYAKNHDIIKEMSEKYFITLDMQPIIVKNGKDVWLEGDPVHLNEQGHVLTAGAIYNILLHDGVIPS